MTQVAVRLFTLLQPSRTTCTHSAPPLFSELPLILQRPYTRQLQLFRRVSNGVTENDLNDDNGNLICGQRAPGIGRVPTASSRRKGDGIITLVNKFPQTPNFRSYPDGRRKLAAAPG